MRLKDKAAIVTGGGQDIGKAVAHAFATEGAAATGVPFEDLMAKIVQNYSLGRMAEESEVAAVAVFLASDESSAITGKTIVSHCGQHIVH